MYINIQSAERLAKALGSAGGAIGGKGDANALTTAMLLQTGNNELAITVVDSSSHQLRLSVPAQVSIPGSILIGADYFPKIVNRLGNHPIQLRVVGNKLQMEVASDKHHADLFQGDPEDFPLDSQLPPIVATVDGDGLKEALDAVMKAATDNDQEIIFCGTAGQDGTGGSLSVYTTNYLTTKSRFQLLELTCNFTFGIPKSVLAGGKLPNWSGAINIHVGEGKVVFSKENEHLLVRRVFENSDVETIETIIGTTPLGKLVVPMQLLRNRVHTIAIGKQTCTIKVAGKVEKNLVVAAENAGVGSSRMEVPISGTIAGTTSELKLDVALFERALKTIDGDDVVIDFVDYVGDGENISLRFANEANPEKRQTLLLCLQ